MTSNGGPAPMVEASRPETEASVRARVGAVVTHHQDGFRSGVARFNELLAERLGVPCLGLPALAGADRPLLSFKVRELDPSSAELVRRWLEAGPGAYELFLHEYAGAGLEDALVTAAERVHCGNAEIRAELAAVAPTATTLWSPGLILDDRPFAETRLSVFSFGMAHKLRVDMFRRLRGLLDATGESYALYVSAANHETASLRDSHLIFDELHEIFPEELYFLGTLSDVAVFNYLRATTFYAAFFESGVRANNSSVASAMERGAVTITNLDPFSPPEYVHGETVLDISRIDRLPTDADELARIGERARGAVAGRGWDDFVENFR